MVRLASKLKHKLKVGCMLQFHNIAKEFSGRILFEGGTFSIASGEKIGLMGRNGTGKSTLLRLIVGQGELDEGDITRPKNYTIGMLEQHLKFLAPTVLQECINALSVDEKEDEYKAKAILNGLGLTENWWTLSPYALSGGLQIRLNLAKLLLGKYNMLLLDEPTNYLDIVSMRWLEQFLKRYEGEIILITHDRDFMDKVVTHTIAIHRQKFTKVKGGHKSMRDYIAQEEKLYESMRLNNEKKRKDLEAFIERFKAKASKAAQAQSRMRMLEKMQEFEELENISNLNLKFNYHDIHAKTLMTVKNLSFAYPGGKTLFENLSFYINKGDKIAIVGANGKGKSTLLNILNQMAEPLTGTIETHSEVRIGHFGQTNIERLSSTATIIEEIESANPDLGTTKVRNICGTMMFSSDDAQKKISILSGGEKSRVLLGKILARPTNLLLLDEPTNHLDQESIDILVEELKKFQGAVVIVTHSEFILREFAQKLIVFREDKQEEFLGDYNTFLEKIGWGDGIAQAASVDKKISHKDLKAKRSEIILERSKVLKPLKTKIEELENKIMKAEEKAAIAQKELIKASENNDGTKIVTFSKDLDLANLDIEEAFLSLEEVSSKLIAEEAMFEEKLKELTGKD